jgi:hypothetical protein
MNNEVNERLVKISAGLTPIEGKLELGDDVQIVIQGNVVKTEQKDLQDGTYDIVYVVKGLIAYVNEEETEPRF